MATTVYDLAIKIALQGVNAARSAIKGLGADLKGAGDALGKLGLAAAGLRTLMAPLGWAKSALIDFNVELESSRIGIAAMASMNLRSMGVGFQDAMAMSELMLTKFQAMAVKSPATTKDFVNMAQGIAGAAYSAGLSTERLMKLTEGAVIGGIAFGIRSDMMALDVSQALKGTLTAKDRIGQMIKAATGMGTKEFNALSGDKRAAAVEKTMQDPAIKAAAEAYGNTFQGQLSTFKDTLQMTLGKVGVPLMKAITAEVAKWNAWISKHPEKIKQWAKDFSDALVRGFNMVRSVFGWIVEHREILFKVALALAALKVGGGIAGTLGAIVPGLGAFGLALAAATAALWLLGKIPGGKGAPQAYMDDLNKGKRGAAMGIREVLGVGSTFGAPKTYAIDRAEFTRAMRGQQAGLEAGRRAALAGNTQNALLTAKKMVGEMKTEGLMKMARPGDDAGKDGAVNIGRIEFNVKSDDPDAFAEDFRDFIGSYVRTGGQADTAYRSPWS